MNTATLTSTPIERPGLLTRSWVVLKHSVRVLFLPWPRYTFDDLAALQDNLDGPAFSRSALGMSRDIEGRRLLRERPMLRVRDTNWIYMSQLPIDSFGYNIWHHFYVNELIKELRLGPATITWDADTEYAKARYRSTHDIRHVLLGLGVELYEEVSLQTFQHAQLAQKLSAMIVVLGGLKLVVVDRNWRKFLAYAPRAWRIGKAGRCVNNIYAEDLWELPLAEVRERYGISAIGERYPVARRHPDAADFPTTFQGVRTYNANESSPC